MRDRSSLPCWKPIYSISIQNGTRKPISISQYYASLYPIGATVKDGGGLDIPRMVYLWALSVGCQRHFAPPCLTESGLIQSLILSIVISTFMISYLRTECECFPSSKCHMSPPVSKVIPIYIKHIFNRVNTKIGIILYKLASVFGNWIYSSVLIDVNRWKTLSD